MGETPTSGTEDGSHPEPDADATSSLELQYREWAEEEAAPAAELEREEVADDAPQEPEPDPVAERLDALQRTLDQLHRTVERQNGFIDQLHADNQRLRQGEAQQLLAPVVRDVAGLHDTIARLTQGASASELQLLDALRRQVVEVLERQGLQAIDPPPGTPLDPAHHQVGGVATTADPALDRTVAAVRRVGFAYVGGRAVRPAEVDVHRHQEPR